MIDIDKYLDIHIKIKIFAETISVKEPSVRLTKELNEIEKNLNKDNRIDIQTEVLTKLLNNNKEGRVFTIEEVEGISFQVQNQLIKKLVSMKIDIDNDPN